MMSLMKNYMLSMVVPRARSAGAIVAVALAGLTACDGKTPTDPPVLASIVITPNPQTLAVGATQQFTVTGTDNAGGTMAVTPVWSVVAGGGTISSTGLFTAGTTTGTFASTVRATSGNLSATATVTVTAGPLATIVVTPNPSTLAVGATQQFTAVGRDAAGNTVAITPTWSVAAGGGTINSTTGLFTAGTSVGTFANTVRATSGAISGSATVNVTAGALATIVVTPNPAALNAGALQQFTAVGRDAGGNAVAITPTWAVVNGGGSIDANTGAFTAGPVAGTFANTVRATSGTISGTATVTVSIPLGPLTSITVTPNPANLITGGVQQFTAVGRDANNNVVAITPVWSVVNGGGTIDAGTGLFTAGGVPGTFLNTVRATSGAISGSATVNIAAAAAATITVTPNPATLPSGTAQQFTAVARDANGNVVPITPVWSVVNGGGSINASTGVFTAGGAPGTFANTVQATSGTISGRATVTVTFVPLATITVTPNPATVMVNGTQQFTAVGRDANGNVMAISPVWSVVNGGGTINATGLFTAGTVTGSFANTVRATVGTISGTATVNVTPGPLATIVLTPNPTTIAVTGTQQFTAVGQDAFGNAVVIAPVFTVVNGGGTINATGLFTAGAVPGTFNNTVQATVGTISVTATVNVIAGPLATITVTPNPATLSPNATQQFTAVGRDASNNVVPITPVWAVINGGGTINATGLFTAGATTGTFMNTVQASSGTVSGTATVAVVPPPAPAFTILANASVTCTGGTITGRVGTFQGPPLGSIILSSCPLVGTTHVGDADAVNAYNSFLTNYDALATQPCGTVLTGTLAGMILAPGVYCFDAAATLTGVLTLTGPANGTWLFRIGTTGTGALTGTNFTVVMAGGAQACNVIWRVTDAVTMTDSNLKGNTLSGVGTTLTRGTFIGNAYARTSVSITDTAVTGC